MFTAFPACEILLMLLNFQYMTRLEVVDEELMKGLRRVKWTVKPDVEHN